MGLFSGWQSAVSSAAQIVANLVGQDIVARSISLTQAAASVAVQVVQGAKISLNGATATKTLAFDGTYVQLSGILNTDADIDIPTSSALYLNGTTRSTGLLFDGSNVKVQGVSPLTPNSDQAINLGSTSLRWSNAYIGSANLIAGTETGTSVLAGGTVNVNVTPVASSGAGSTLMTYNLPANALTTALRGIKIEAWGHVTNNANAKTVSLAFGSQTAISKALNVSLANGLWKLTATVVRTGASTQQIFGEGWNNDAIAVSGTDGATILYAATQTNGTQTETAAITIKGVATTATTTDITQDGMIVSYF